jgi:hypothetical protein
MNPEVKNTHLKQPILLFYDTKNTASKKTHSSFKGQVFFHINLQTWGLYLNLRQRHSQ